MKDLIDYYIPKQRYEEITGRSVHECNQQLFVLPIYPGVKLIMTSLLLDELVES
tara:strand:+ start:227 stop:388 length:162 start_codon:yes stop_codon:yes gene_type:complete